MSLSFVGNRLQGGRMETETPTILRRCGYNPVRDAGGLDQCGSHGDSEKGSGSGCVWKMVLAGLANSLNAKSEKKLSV